ncbi:heme-binding protein [Sphingomonas sp. HITSZ_GF]|uniref:SOUL family heme-binding protein n=1 Tax=Sphingomonas sp. HITSZ_GF TaxID=3037247 RepID=UPI00240E0FD5|nr:heme-binding protein [Sphingomonas sp. HITSZ_GF]MDG2535032.1 heme-binding protein [Sphingomonas sp. HITSZ_GF]
MQINARMIGAGVAAAVAAGIGYVLLSRSREDAAFQTVTRDGDFSVRDYPRLLVAEVVVPGLRQAALSVGFTRLADHVFGRGSPHARMPVPVFADGDEDGRGWRTRLLMPADAAVDALGDTGDGVRLRTLPARRIAALRFAGQDSEGALDAHEAELRAWIGANGLRPAGPVEHAFYNSPFTPARLRRTEVLIPLAA